MNTELNQLTDEQLDTVAGGCGHRHGKREHEGYGDKGGKKGWGGGMPWAMGGYPDIDVQLNITVIAGNTIEAGGPVTITVDQSNALS